MIIKGRSPTAPTELLWTGHLTESTLDPKVQIKYVESKKQLADIPTKGSFTRDGWQNLLHLFNIMNDTTFSCSHFSNSHPFLPAGKQSEMSKRSQERSSPGSPTTKAKSCCLVSRHVSVGQDYSSNPESPGVRETLKCGHGKKEVRNPDGILFSMPRETESMVQKFLEVSQRRKLRETESTREKVVQNLKRPTLTRWTHLGNIDELRENAHFDADAIYGFIVAGSIAHGSKLRKEFGNIQEFWIWEHQGFVRDYKNDDWRKFRD